MRHRRLNPEPHLVLSPALTVGSHHHRAFLRSSEHARLFFFLFLPSLSIQPFGVQLQTHPCLKHIDTEIFPSRTFLVNLILAQSRISSCGLPSQPVSSSLNCRCTRGWLGSALPIRQHSAMQASPLGNCLKLGLPTFWSRLRKCMHSTPAGSAARQVTLPPR